MKTISHTLNYTMVDYIVRITMPNKFLFQSTLHFFNFIWGLTHGSEPNEYLTSSAPFHSLVILRGFDRGILDIRDLILNHGGHWVTIEHLRILWLFFL